ncbi:MAG: circularly permuted type 2 ATP-grasp protein [Terrimicrobiaceae bacterium]|nr:circularly permuted type 2 ATP-grasp protein [Terrimicrobiaceae bacterium]
MRSSGRATDFPLWNETFAEDGSPRGGYRPLFERLHSMPRSRVRSLDERLEATMREMGVTFDVSRERPWGSRPWFCDLMPQIFTAEEWETISAGLCQRLRAFEFFLRDVYSGKSILREEQVPIQPVLGSPFFQRAASGLPAPGGAYLHLSGAAICRLPDGSLAVKHHYFSNASGISYMMQNRRALARVIPQSFHESAIHPISDAPIDILEMLRSLSGVSDPAVVLLTPGPGSAVFSEHSFLARRMGIPLVQGGDLLVLNDAVYLKTVSGLQRVEIIYTRVSDPWLDPMVFRRDSLLGVPGLVHCIRKGTVMVVNGIGSQLADDRSLLPLAPQIIRYYLGERPILKTLPTFWLGDLDQKEMVLSDVSDYTIRPLYGERIVLGGDGRRPDAKQIDAALAEILPNASQFVAQPQACDALTVSFGNGKPTLRRQDHIVFAWRVGEGDYEVFPGALTRISTEQSPYTASELGGGSKDTWVYVGFENDPELPDAPRAQDAILPAQHVTSRVAESFYWLGRYLERASNVAGMVGIIELLELEELNPTERTHYRPVWNTILPPLEGTGTGSRRTISSPVGRYRLTLDTAEPGSVVSTILRAAANAESVTEALSLEAWGVISQLRDRFRSTRFQPHAEPETLAAASRRLCDFARQLIPQFFGTAEYTMVADGGWKFCEIGQMIERAAITANAVSSIVKPLLEPDDESDHAMEIRLSAFLRLLNSRDVYRRVYQARIEPVPLLDLLWKNPMAPRSVVRCLLGCSQRLTESSGSASPAVERSVAAIDSLVHAIQSTDWEGLLPVPGADKPKKSPLAAHCESLLERVLSIHDLVSDGFLNHQVHMRHEIQPPLPGLKNAL